MIRGVGHNATYSTEALELIALRSYMSTRNKQLVPEWLVLSAVTKSVYAYKLRRAHV